MAKRFIFPIIVSVALGAGGVAAVNLTDGRNKVLEVFKDGIDEINNRDDYNEFYNNLAKYEKYLPSDFIEEANEVKPHYLALIDNASVVDTTESLYVYNAEYEYFSSKQFNYISSSRVYSRLFNVYPYLSKLSGINIENDAGNALKWEVSKNAFNFKYTIKFTVKYGSKNTRTYEWTTESPNCLFEYCENSSRSSKPLQFYFTGPFAFSVYEKSAYSSSSKIEFDIAKKVTDNVNSELEKLSKSNVDSVCETINKYSFVFPEKFITTFKNIETYLKDYLKYGTDFSEDEKTMLKRDNEMFEYLYHRSEPVVSDEFLLSKLLKYPYFSTLANKEYTNSDGYSISYSYNETNASTGKGECSFVLNLPIEKDKAAEKLVISAEPESEISTFTCSYGAYKLIDIGKELESHNIKIEIESAYVFNVTTPAGTFKFDKYEKEKAEIIEAVKNLTLSNYTSTLSSVNSNAYLLPTDLVDEYKSLNETIKKLMSNYSSTFSTYDELLTFQNNAYKLISTQNLKYFDTNNLYSYFLVYPYFAEYKGNVISDFNGNTVQFVYAEKTGPDGYYTDQFNLHIPMEEGKEAEDVVFTKSRSTTSNICYRAQEMIDTNAKIKEMNITLSFVSPHVVKVTTPAGSYTFDFKANDDLILMESINHMTDSNYKSTLEKIDANLSKLPKDFQIEYNEVKSSIVYLFKNHKYKETGVEKEMYDKIYSLLVETPRKYINPNSFLEYFIIYTYFIGKQDVVFKCVDDENITFSYTFTETLSTLNKGKLKLTYCIPLKEGVTPSSRTITSMDSVSSDLTCENHLFCIFDSGYPFTYNNIDLKFSFVKEGFIKAITPAGEFLFDVR